MEPKYFTKEEISKVFNFSKRTLERRIASGEFPKEVFRDGRLLRWTQKEIDAYAEKHRPETRAAV